MALSDALAALEAKEIIIIRGKDVCHFAAFYARLLKPDQITLNELIARGVSTRIMISLLAEEGYKIGVERFNDHTKGRCSCGKKVAK